MDLNSDLICDVYLDKLVWLKFYRKICFVSWLFFIVSNWFYNLDDVYVWKYWYGVKFSCENFLFILKFR